MALALLLWAPTGISHEDQTIVTGHSTFYNGDVYDKCLGSIAGIIKSKVMWFNNAVLVERYSGKGTFVYVTEAGAGDPRAEDRLYSDGVFYDFVDPNGAHWHIEELYYDKDDKFDIQGGVQDGTPPVPYVDRVSLSTNKTFVWVVELSSRPIFDEFAGANPHTYYNFVTLVDTCKFHPYVNNWTDAHDNASGLLNDDHGHENGAAPHTHEAFSVNLWVGTAPAVVVPNGASTAGAQWETEWASTEGAQTAEENGVHPDTGPDMGDLAP